MIPGRQGHRGSIVSVVGANALTRRHAVRSDKVLPQLLRQQEDQALFRAVEEKADIIRSRRRAKVQRAQEIEKETSMEGRAVAEEIRFQRAEETKARVAAAFLNRTPSIREMRRAQAEEDERLELARRNLSRESILQHWQAEVIARREWMAQLSATDPIPSTLASRGCSAAGRRHASRLAKLAPHVPFFHQEGGVSWANVDNPQLYPSHQVAIEVHESRLASSASETALVQQLAVLGVPSATVLSHPSPMHRPRSAQVWQPHAAHTYATVDLSRLSASGMAS